MIKELEKVVQKGDWPQIPPLRKKEKLEKGMQDSRVLALRERLKASGYLKKKVKKEEREVFDEHVEEALKEFQRQHGLNQDGVVGHKTWKALNTTAAKRIAQLRYNQEKIAKLPLALEGKYILVNVPDFHLKVVNHDHVDLQMRVIVGRRNYRHRTPLFSDQMEYIVFSPKWHVPRSIAVKEMLPQIQKDPEYLQKKNFKVYQNIEGETVEVDSATINWQDVNQGEFNYRFSQNSGGGNALGNIKFMFPNKHNVYLHDTNARSLFVRDDRALSHGCVRIEKPLALAEYVLKDKQNWSKAKIQSAMTNGKEQYINLPQKLPVHIVYITAWVDENGIPQFRDDVYGYDKI